MPRPMSLRTSDPRRRFVGFAVAVVLLLHVGVALWAAAKESVTTDEILYVTGGYYIDKFGDYRIQPENGVLPQRLHGLAAVWSGAPHPAFIDNEYWRSSSNLVSGYQFFYETGHDHFPMLMLARALNTLFSVGTGLLVFAWARHLAGPHAGLAAGFAALGLYAADPNFLAHAPLATSDLAAVFFLLASASAFWWQLARPTPVRVGTSAVVFGLACVAKYSAVLLLPVFAGLLVWRVAVDAERRRWLARAPLLIFAHLAGAFALIWLCYGLRFSGFSPQLPPADHYAAAWPDVLPYIGWQGRVVELALRWRLLPEAFLYGYAWVILSTLARASFLAGQYGIFGWVSFFPLAFAWKTTLAVLLAGVAALATLGRRWATQPARLRPDLFAAAPLLLFFAVYWAFSLTSHLNIGHRHLLPIYPAIFIGLGVWAATVPSGGWRRVTLGLMLGAQLLASATVAPHFLAFFNRAAGGPANGYRLLVDSSLDWGQDLPGLRDWLKQHNTGPAARPVFLSYFGSGEPNYYGIVATHLPFTNGFKFPLTWHDPQPGLYCISATMVQQVYSGFGGEWTPALEKEYRVLRPLEPSFHNFLTRPETRPALLEQADARRWNRLWTRYSELRFARLCAFLRQRQPDAHVGWSILIYRVDARELAEALDPAVR